MGLSVRISTIMNSPVLFVAFSTSTSPDNFHQLSWNPTCIPFCFCLTVGPIGIPPNAFIAVHECISLWMFVFKIEFMELYIGNGGTTILYSQIEVDCRPFYFVRLIREKCRLGFKRMAVT